MICAVCGKKNNPRDRFCRACGHTLEKREAPTAGVVAVDSGWAEWKIESLIGEGSFGKVYRARRQEFGQTYESAIKVIAIPQNASEIATAKAEGMGDAEVKEYFRGFVSEWIKEIKLMESLKAMQNIVSIEDYKVVERTDGIGWTISIRMELLTGLNDYITNNRITKRQIIDLGIGICKALEFCQKLNIIHRDIKPENIFVSKFGDFKLGDFGIARQIEKTTAGLSKKGTYSYMAPEVYLGGAYNSTVDIYSLGIVLYRFLNNNRTPFLPDYPQTITFTDRENATQRRMTGEALPKPCNADGRLAEIVLRACSFHPKERYDSPKEMREALEAIHYDEQQAALIYPAGDVLQNSTVTPSGATEQAPSRTESFLESKKAEATARQFLTQAPVAVGLPIDPDPAARDTAKFTSSESTVAPAAVPRKKRRRALWIGVVAACAVVLVGAAYGIYTQLLAPAAKVAVPDVHGLSREAAMNELQSAGFVVEFTEMVDETAPVGTIRAQSLNADEKYRKGTVITLEVVVPASDVTDPAATATPGVTVPDVSSLTSDAATSALVALGLKTEITEAFSDTIAKGNPISQDPAAGTVVEPGRTVQLVYSKGKEFGTIPQVVGKTLDEATKLLEDLGFTVQTKTQVDDSGTAGIVLSVSAKEGTSAPLADAVVLLVRTSSGKVAVPNLVGRTATEALELLKTAGFVASTTEQYSDTVANGTVISQGTVAGTKILKGTTISLVVSKGKSIFSEWMVALPAGITATDYIIEHKTQYHFCEKSTTTVTDSSLAGWTADGSAWASAPYEDASFEYAPMPAGFFTSNAYYAIYNKVPLTTSSTSTIKTIASSTATGYYLYWHWCRNDQTLNLGYNRQTSDHYTTEFWGFHAFVGVDAPYVDVALSYKYPMASACEDSYWWFRVAISKCTYQKYHMMFSYYKWSAYSAWQDTYVATSNTVNVETQIVYHYRAKH